MPTILGTNLGRGSVRLDADPDGRFTVWCSGDFIRIRPISYPTVEQSAVFTLLKGNFPPVERLFPTDDTKFGADNPLNLKMSFIARIGAATKWLDARGSGCARFQFTVTENANKPGPVYIEVGDRFQALVQPNLLLR